MAAAGGRTDAIAARLAHAVVKPLVGGVSRLLFALDDTPTERYGRRVQGVGVRHNPTPGPAGSPLVYGRVWVVLGLLATHPAWGVIALPLLARLYVRERILPGIAPKYRPPFRTKLELAVELMRWAWQRAEQDLVGHRSASPWDDGSRRPSHADKRRAWRRELLTAESQAVLRLGLTGPEIRAAAERLLNLAA